MKKIFLISICIFFTGISYSEASPQLESTAKALEGTGFYLRNFATYAQYEMTSYTLKIKNRGGFAAQTIDTKQSLTEGNSIGIGIVCGYDFKDSSLKLPFRLEGEMSYRFGGTINSYVDFDVELADGSSKPLSMHSELFFAYAGSTLMNLWLDIPLWKNFKPFVGVSGGFVTVVYKCEVTREYDNRTLTTSVDSGGGALQYGFGGGFNYQYTPNRSVNFMFRHLNTKDISIDVPRFHAAFYAQPKITDATLGFMFKF